MTNEELDKLEAALDKYEQAEDFCDADGECDVQDQWDYQRIRDAARSHLAAQRQAPADRAALDALSDLIKCAAILATGEYAASEYQEDYGAKVPKSVLAQIRKQNERMLSLAQRMKRNTDSIRAALTSSVPVGVVRKAMAAMKSAQDIFHHYGDLHQAKGTDEGNEKAFVNREHAAALGKALRELEPYIKKDENK